MTSVDDSFRIAEMLAAGMKCSHVLMTLALEARGETDPKLVRAMSGLALGMGQGFNCGALSAGCCVLGLHAGRAREDEADDPRFAAMLDDFSGWFHTLAEKRWGGIDCADIMKFDPALKAERCPALIAEVWDEVVATLREKGLDPAAANPDAEETAP